MLNFQLSFFLVFFEHFIKNQHPDNWNYFITEEHEQAQFKIAGSYMLVLSVFNRLSKSSIEWK